MVRVRREGRSGRRRKLGRNLIFAGVSEVPETRAKLRQEVLPDCGCVGWADPSRVADRERQHWGVLVFELGRLLSVVLFGQLEFSFGWSLEWKWRTV